MEPESRAAVMEATPQQVHVAVDISVSHWVGSTSSPTVAIHKKVCAAASGQVQSDVLREAVEAALDELKGKSPQHIKDHALPIRGPAITLCNALRGMRLPEQAEQAWVSLDGLLHMPVAE